MTNCIPNRFVHMCVRLLLAVMTVVFLTVMTGCGDDATPDRGEIVLAAARDLVPGEKDPYYTSSILQVWEPLVALGDDGRPRPALAVSWSHDEDSRTWDFALKRGVRFHDGEPFDAAAVLANFDRWSVMGYKASPFYGTSLEKMYPSVRTWEALDEYTVRLHFDNPVPMLPYMMASWSSAVFSPKCLNPKNGDFVGVAQGTGPFRLVESVRNQYAVLERFDGYHGEKAKAERIRVRVIPSPETRFSALKAEEIMGVLDLGPLTPALATELLKDERFASSVNRTTITHYLTLRGDAGVFADERMKRALSLAIDRRAIATNYFYGLVTPTMNLINGTSPFGRTVEPIYDPEKAAALVREATGGKRANVLFVIPQYGVERYPYKETAEWIQAELAAVGIDAELRIVDGTAYKIMMRDGRYDIAIHTRGLATMDPLKLLIEWMANDERGTLNREQHIGYRNERAQKITEELEAFSTEETRAAGYRELQDIALEHPVVIPLFEDTNIALHNKKISGFDPGIYGVTLSETGWAR